MESDQLQNVLSTDNFFICKMCGYNFNKDENKPIALPCGHTFCYSCINTVYSIIMYVKCSKCLKKAFY